MSVVKLMFGTLAIFLAIAFLTQSCIIGKTVSVIYKLGSLYRGLIE